MMRSGKEKLVTIRGLVFDERPAMPIKNLSIITEEGRGIFPLRSEIARS
jgi:hypothetical protein